MIDIDPSQAASLDDLVACLRQVHLAADKPSYRALEQQTLHQAGFLPGTRLRRVRLGRSTVSDVLTGRRFPSKAFLLTFLDACGVNLDNDPRWGQAWDDVALQYNSQRYAEDVPNPGDDQEDLLLRVYIPSERLYAAEADRLMSLFRDWLMTTRSYGIRQTSYSNASGKMYEFFSDVSAVKVDLREDFSNFSDFLALCSKSPSAAAGMLTPMGLASATSVEVVVRFAREIRRLQTDLVHERERRILTIRHTLEEELADHGFDLRAIPSAEINALIESHVPGPSASDSLALLAASQSTQTIQPVTLNINQQFINAIESTIFQNVRGTFHLGPEAKELLALVDRFGGHEAPLLEASVHELEDTNAAPAKRLAAKQRLKKFLGQITGTVHVVGIDLLEKYIERKLGL